MHMSTTIAHGNPGRQNTFRFDGGLGEYYVAKTGIAYSEPAIRGYFDRETLTADDGPTAPWLRAESAELLTRVETNPATLVEGDMGAGKSTALFGLRALLRNQGVPYIVINGHFLNRGRAMARAVTRATRLGQTVLFDSFDYLFMKNAANGNAKRARPPVLAAVRNHLAAGGSFVGSMHTAPWFGRYSNPELTDQMTTFREETGAGVHRVHGYLADDEDLRSVCEQVHGPDYGAVYPGYAVSSNQPTARTYRVAKLVGREVGGAAGLVGLPQAEFDVQVQSIDDATRAKMNAGQDYPLLPPQLTTV
jgi:hypothetical protein